MIIGCILDTGTSSSSPNNNSHNGASCVVFYTEQDALNWCIAMSEGYAFGANPMLYAWTVLHNTDTGVRRWWYNGVEFTG